MPSKKTAVIQIGILIVLSFGVVFSLVLPEVTNAKQNLVEISLFLREWDNALSSNTRLGMEAAAVTYGAELRFIAPSSSTETHEEQLENLYREIEGGAMALVVAPVDPEALTEDLIDFGNIPLIPMESQVEGSGVGVFLDNHALGRQLAQAVVEDTQEGDTILVLDTAMERIGIRERLDSCVEELEAQGRNYVVRTTHETITIPPEVVAVVAVDSKTTLQLVSWQVTQSGKHLIYGMGGTAEIAANLERGLLKATVAWSDYAVGYLTVQRATKLAQGMYVEDISYLPITTIRGETIYDSDHQKLLFPVV